MLFFSACVGTLSVEHWLIMDESKFAVCNKMIIVWEAIDSQLQSICICAFVNHACFRFVSGLTFVAILFVVKVVRLGYPNTLDIFSNAVKSKYFGTSLPCLVLVIGMIVLLLLSEIVLVIKSMHCKYKYILILISLPLQIASNGFT